MAGLRRKLVQELKLKGIDSTCVLDALGAVPRQLFFPKDFTLFAYRDAAFPIGEGQTISQPYTVGFQTQLLGLKAGDKVLEIGTGSGYQAAVLSALGAKVHSIELIRSLLVQAAQVLNKLDREMILYHGDGSQGLAEFAPYDGIIVTAGAPEIPIAYINQLKLGGRLVIPVGGEKNAQKMMRITKLSDNQTKTEVFGDFKFVPLVGKSGWKES
jgi:protein-L-isoaspartate(D-aspartate) O-methyltransferase